MLLVCPSRREGRKVTRAHETDHHSGVGYPHCEEDHINHNADSIVALKCRGDIYINQQQPPDRSDHFCLIVMLRGLQYRESRVLSSTLVTLAEKKNAKSSDLSKRHLPVKRAIKSRQIHLTQQPKSSDSLHATSTAHTLAITNISFVRLSTDSLVREYYSGGIYISQ
ncbi:hypothetical protein TNCV_3037681 [Trichonephila clavipes]|nr:hypothetical protein TNCV_3037681 [Trichonephila clavipes]